VSENIRGVGEKGGIMGVRKEGYYVEGADSVLGDDGGESYTCPYSYAGVAVCAGRVGD
jgi:hypothetical protein